MKKLKVKELKPGMRFDSQVFIDPDNVLVQRDTPLAQKDIDRLLRWGIEEVETNGNLIPGSDDASSKEDYEPAEPAPGSPESLAGAAVEMKRHNDYEKMRKLRPNLARRLELAGKTLETGIKSLQEGKPFNNQDILKVSETAVEDLNAVPFPALAVTQQTFSNNQLIQHSVLTAWYAIDIGRALSLSRPRLQELFMATLLMDTGMFLLDPGLLFKEQSFTEEERNKVRTHPLTGYQALLHQGHVKSALADVAVQHHENFDGKGYPRGLKGKQITDYARIATIADCFTAMTEPRPHRESMMPYEAMKTMLSTDTSKFDPVLLRLFVGLQSVYPVGSLVELSTQQIGLIIQAHASKPMRPVIRILRDEGRALDKITFIDLKSSPGIYIVRAVSNKEARISLLDEI